MTKCNGCIHLPICSSREEKCQYYQSKADICRGLVKKAETKIMEILDPIRKESWNITMDKPSNEIISAGNFMCDILEELLAEMEKER